MSRLTVRSTQIPIQYVSKALPEGVKSTKREINQLLPSSAAFKNSSTPQEAVFN
jgi:hypothetical protein